MNMSAGGLACRQAACQVDLWEYWIGQVGQTGHYLLTDWKTTQDYLHFAKIFDLYFRLAL